MKTIKGIWNGDERIVNGVGRLTPGPVALPEASAAEFERQGLFTPDRKKPKVKESDDVRADD